MNELLKNINEHTSKNNVKVCYLLYNLIDELNITNINELQKIEDNYFNTSDISTRNKIKYNSYINDITHIEKLTQNELHQLEQYKKIYSSITDELEKTKYLILIYEILKWNMCFPYTAYKLILEDKLQ